MPDNLTPSERPQPKRHYSDCPHAHTASSGNAECSCPPAPEHPQEEPEEVHPCDESLGHIHQCAISLQMAGQHELAVLLAKAHEAIQTYLLSELLQRDHLTTRVRANLSNDAIQSLIDDLKQRKDEVQRLEGELAEARKCRWTCFHCGFETSDPAEAQAHFGERDDAEEFTPLCKWWSKLTAEERAQEIQDLNRQIEAEQDDNALLRTRIEGLKHLVEGQRSEIHSFKPFRQCDTLQQVFNVYNSMEGRALAVEEARDRLIAENAELRKDKELLDRRRSQPSR